MAREKKPKWMSIWAMKSLNAPMVMITVTATNPSVSPAAMAVWIFRFLKTENRLLSHKWSKNDRKTSLTLTRRSFLCMPKALPHGRFLTHWTISMVLRLRKVLFQT